MSADRHGSQQPGPSRKRRAPVGKRIPGGRNFATLLPDEVTGVLFITDLQSGHRLYKYGPCRICGISNWGWSRYLQEDCSACRTPEANDNDKPVASAPGCA